MKTLSTAAVDKGLAGGVISLSLSLSLSANTVPNCLFRGSK
jgi:hypothetical protein